MVHEHPKQAFQFSSARLEPQTAAPDDIYALQVLLARYGYLSGGYKPGCYDKCTAYAVSQFQSFYRIYPEEDGVCDEETVKLITTQRCGNQDCTPGQRMSSGRLAPFVTVGSKWNKAVLSYRFLNATPDLAVDRQQEIIREAFGRWADVCGLQFNEIPADDPTDLSIAFHRASHGDGEPFDNAGGPDGNTLAHAFFPPPAGGSWAGSLHFDEFERWKDEPGGAGIRLYNVALHEIGHLLGLSHSQDTNAIMYAYYAEDRNDLRADDIAGIQSLYGAPLADPVAISPGQSVSGHLPQTHAQVQYQVTLQNKLLVKLDGPAGADFDLYVRYGAPAGLEVGQYDAVSYGLTSDEFVTINNPQAGTYYVLVYSYQGGGSYTLEVEVV